MLAIKNIKFAIAKANIKYQDREDLLLVTFPNNTVCAGAFSTSSIVSATIDWDRKILTSKIKPKALLVNSGNANSFTGKYGKQAIEITTKELARKLNILPEEILVSSTGVIGEKLPYEKIIGKYDELIANLKEENIQESAKAIMTTDSFAKFLSITTNIAGKKITISTIFKGSGMIAPNMATMLAYFWTDAVISQEILEQMFLSFLGDSFNAITIDGDASTNDTALIFASQSAGNPSAESIDDEILVDFKKDLKQLMIDSSLVLLKDGEGATKIAKIYISGAENIIAAKKVGMAIANSPLFKTALNGCDPNWGRIIMAIGKSKEKINQEKFFLDIGKYNIVSQGELNPNYNEAETTVIYMKEENVIEFFIDMGMSSKKNQKIISTCDLSKGYVDINADYRS